MGTLVVFLIVFLPMGWLLWRMLRYTRDTIGTNSPLKVQRIYRTTFRSFFVRLDYIYVVFCLLMFWVFMQAVLVSRFSPPYPELGRVMLALFALMMLGVPAWVLAVDFNHWPYANGVTITTFPEVDEMEVELPDAVLRLKQGDIERIEVYQNNGKLQLGFAVYFLASGTHFILPFKTEGRWVIEEYFKGIPVSYSDRFIPRIPARLAAAEAASEQATGTKENAVAVNNPYAWTPPAVTALLGACLLWMTYMMYLDSRWEDEMSTRAPVVCMKILYGTRGAGTVKYPDKVHAEYNGKTYHFEMGRKTFRSLLGVDTIAAHYDAESDRAFLPGSGRVKHYLPLYLWIGGIALAITGGGTWQLFKHFRPHFQRSQ